MNLGNILRTMKRLLVVVLLVLSGQAQVPDLRLDRAEEGLGFHHGDRHSGHEGVE